MQEEIDVLPAYLGMQEIKRKTLRDTIQEEMISADAVGVTGDAKTRLGVSVDQLENHDDD